MAVLMLVHIILLMEKYTLCVCVCVFACMVCDVDMCTYVCVCVLACVVCAVSRQCVLVGILV